MMTHLKFNSFFCPVAIFFLLAGCSSTHLLRCKDQQAVEIKIVGAELRTAPFICVGEVHTETRHHEDQLEIIQNLHDSGVDLALGLEMFDFTQQAALNRWNQGDLDWPGFTQLYAQNWKVPLEMYAPVFLYAKEKRIPLIGLNLPQALAHKVASQGFSSLTPVEMEGLPDSLSCEQDSVQMRLLRQMLTAHGGDDQRFQNFCETQTLRDTTMALNAYRYQERYPQKTLLIMAGIGHCLRQGLVGPLEKYSGKRATVILPAVSDQILGQTLTADDADFVLQ